MKTVYMVTIGEYEEREPTAAFSTRELAEQYVADCSYEDVCLYIGNEAAFVDLIEWENENIAPEFPPRPKFDHFRDNDRSYPKEWNAILASWKAECDEIENSARYTERRNNFLEGRKIFHAGRVKTILREELMKDNHSYQTYRINEIPFLDGKI